MCSLNDARCRIVLAAILMLKIASRYLMTYLMAQTRLVFFDFSAHLDGSDVLGNDTEVSERCS